MLRCIPFLFLLVCLSLRTTANNTLWYALVLENGYWKAIDRDGQVLADSLCRGGDPYVIDYRFYADFADGLFPCLREGLWGFKNHRNELVVPCRYRDIAHFAQGCAPVASGARWGLVDCRGEIVLPFEYDYVSVPDSLGLVIAHRDQKLSVFDVAGHPIVLPWYRTASFLEPGFSEGLMPVLAPASGGGSPAPGIQFLFRNPWQPGKVGFIDRRGKLIIDTMYTLNGTVGDRRQELYPWYGCGSGLQQAREFAEAHPFYSKGDYYHFRNDRCIVMGSQGPMVINRKGDSLFALPGNASEVRNYRGFIAVRIDPPVRIPGISSTSETHLTGPYKLYHPDGRLLKEGCWSVSYAEADDALYLTDRYSDTYFVDTQGNLVKGRRESHLAARPAGGRYWFADKGKYGYKDTNDVVRITARYESVTNFRRAMIVD